MAVWCCRHWLRWHGADWPGVAKSAATCRTRATAASSNERTGNGRRAFSMHPTRRRNQHRHDSMAWPSWPTRPHGTQDCLRLQRRVRAAARCHKPWGRDGDTSVQWSRLRLPHRSLRSAACEARVRLRGGVRDGRAGPATTQRALYCGRGPPRLSGSGVAQLGAAMDDRSGVGVPRPQRHQGHARPLRASHR